jgi:hypothetical protein
MPLKCRYCGSRKGTGHTANCRTRTSSVTYPDSSLYITTTASDSSWSPSSSSDCGSSSSSSGGGDCG